MFRYIVFAALSMCVMMTSQYSSANEIKPSQRTGPDAREDGMFSLDWNNGSKPVELNVTGFKTVNNDGEKIIALLGLSSAQPDLDLPSIMAIKYDNAEYLCQQNGSTYLCEQSVFTSSFKNPIKVTFEPKSDSNLNKRIDGILGNDGRFDQTFNNDTASSDAHIMMVRDPTYSLRMIRFTTKARCENAIKMLGTMEFSNTPKNAACVPE